MEFTHFDSEGNAWMVDVSDKDVTRREALACGEIHMSAECFDMVKAGQMKKGDVLGVARIAGIMGAKKTSDLIPLCHNLNLTGLEVWFETVDEMLELGTDTAVTLEQVGISESNAKQKFTKESDYEIATVDGIKVVHKRSENRITYLGKSYKRWKGRMWLEI